MILRIYWEQKSAGKWIAPGCQFTLSNFFTREKIIRDRGENLHRFVFVFFSSTIFSHFGRSRRHMLDG